MRVHELPRQGSADYVARAQHQLFAPLVIVMSAVMIVVMAVRKMMSCTLPSSVSGRWCQVTCEVFQECNIQIPELVYFKITPI